METQTIQHFHPRMVLQRALLQRCQRNPKYSLRAFARALDICPSTLSKILNGKRSLPKTKALEVANELELNPAERELFLSNFNTKDKVVESEVDLALLEMDQFAIIADWYHYAILSLLELPEASIDPQWISKRLSITQVEAKDAIERLTRLKMIEEVDGVWKQATSPIQMNNKSSSAAARKFHKQLLTKAIDSLENDSFDRRSLSSMTFEMDASQMQLARTEIKKFRHYLQTLLSSQGSPSDVYNLTVQLIPATKNEK